MSPANAILVFPVHPGLRQLSGKRIPLTFRPPHPKSSKVHPSLIDPDGEIINVESFRRLRVKLGAWIETDDLDCVRKALAVPENEPGIVPLRIGGATALPSG